MLICCNANTILKKHKIHVVIFLFDLSILIPLLLSSEIIIGNTLFVGILVACHIYLLL